MQDCKSCENEIPWVLRSKALPSQWLTSSLAGHWMYSWTLDTARLESHSDIWELLYPIKIVNLPSLTRPWQSHVPMFLPDMRNTSRGAVSLKFCSNFIHRERWRRFALHGVCQVGCLAMQRKLYNNTRRQRIMVASLGKYKDIAKRLHTFPCCSLQATGITRYNSTASCQTVQHTEADKWLSPLSWHWDYHDLTTSYHLSLNTPSLCRQDKDNLLIGNSGQLKTLDKNTHYWLDIIMYVWYTYDTNHTA